MQNFIIVLENPTVERLDALTEAMMIWQEEYIKWLESDDPEAIIMRKKHNYPAKVTKIP